VLAAEINRKEDEIALEEAFAGSDDSEGGAGIEWERMSAEEGKGQTTGGIAVGGEGDGEGRDEDCLSLEEAIRFAKGIAEKHVTVKTRDMKKVDVTKLMNKGGTEIGEEKQDVTESSENDEDGIPSFDAV